MKASVLLIVLFTVFSAAALGGQTMKMESGGNDTILASSSADSSDTLSGPLPAGGGEMSGMIKSIIFTGILFAAFALFYIFSKKKS